MRIILCGVAAVALSGCSWMGLGGNKSHTSYGGDGHYSNASSDDCCVGGKTLSRWNIEGGIGTDFVVGGDALTGSQQHAGFNFPTTTLVDVSAKDAYSQGYRADLGTSYALNPNRKVLVNGFYSQAEGEEVDFGTQGGGTLRGTMSDYKAYGVEAGLRQYMKPTRAPLLKSVRPYVEGRLGAAYLDGSSLTNINQVGGLLDARTPTSLAINQSGWVPTASGLVGIETPVFNRFTMGVETGIRYVGTPKSDNTQTASGTFDDRYGGINNGGDRLSIPLTLRGRYRF